MDNSKEGIEKKLTEAGMPVLCTRNDLHEFLPWKKHYIQKMLANHELPGTKLRGRHVCWRSDLAGFLAEQLSSKLR